MKACALSMLVLDAINANYVRIPLSRQVINDGKPDAKPYDVIYYTDDI